MTSHLLSVCYTGMLCWDILGRLCIHLALIFWCLHSLTQNDSGPIIAHLSVCAALQTCLLTGKDNHHIQVISYHNNCVIIQPLIL